MTTVELIFALFIFGILWIVSALILTNVIKDDATILAITVPLFLLLYAAYVKGAIQRPIL